MRPSTVWITQKLLNFNRFISPSGPVSAERTIFFKGGGTQAKTFPLSAHVIFG